MAMSKIFLLYHIHFLRKSTSIPGLKFEKVNAVIQIINRNFKSGGIGCNSGRPNLLACYSVKLAKRFFSIGRKGYEDFVGSGVGEYGKIEVF